MAKTVEQINDDSNYTESLLERENYLSTVYQNGIAMPHPIQMKGKRNLISIALLPEGAKHSSKEPKIIFMISLKPNQLEVHQLISKELNKVMNNITGITKLLACSTYQEFIYILREIIGGY